MSHKNWKKKKKIICIKKKILTFYYKIYKKKLQNYKNQIKDSFKIKNY